jgi:hypothetical protein
MESGQIYLTANNMACKIMVLIKTLEELNA